MRDITNTLFIGKVLHHFEALPSTNAFAQDLITKKGGYTEGVVVTTFNQTAGRGQMGNRWESEPEMNIAFSTILHPTFLSANEQFHLNKTIALAVYDFISSFTDRVSIKWANDILIREKKICGILIQNTLMASKMNVSVIGIGININQNNFNGLPHATSLLKETGQNHNLFDLVEKLCECLEKRYLFLKTRQFDKLHDEYMSKLFRYGEDTLYQNIHGEYFMGKIIDVTDTGLLRILTKNGIQNFEIKEVKFTFS